MSMAKLLIVSDCTMSNSGRIRFWSTNSSKFLDFASIFGATWFPRLVTTSRPPENRTWTRKWTQNRGNLDSYDSICRMRPALDTMLANSTESFIVETIHPKN